MSTAATTALLAMTVAIGCAAPGARSNDDARGSVLLYDQFREAALRRDWPRAETLYQELRTKTLPQELVQALAYHAALAAYDAGDWARAAQRAEAGLSADAASPWRSSLYELLGLSRERLGQRDAALKAYGSADLASARARARNLTRPATPSPVPAGHRAPGAP